MSSSSLRTGDLDIGRSDSHHLSANLKQQMFIEENVYLLEILIISSKILKILFLPTKLSLN